MSRYDTGTRGWHWGTTTFLIRCTSMDPAPCGENRPREVEGLVTGLPRALRALANKAVVTRDGPHPWAELEPSPPGASVVVLAGRATHVP